MSQSNQFKLSVSTTENAVSDTALSTHLSVAIADSIEAAFSHSYFSTTNLDSDYNTNNYNYIADDYHSGDIVTQPRNHSYAQNNSASYQSALNYSSSSKVQQVRF